jgi:hypothetical protein
MGRRLTLRHGLLVVAAILVASVVTVALAVVSGDGERGVRTATSPGGESFPLSRAVDQGSLEYRGTLGDAEVYLADGIGPTAGMTCLVIATSALTRTACDTPSAVQERGLLLSESLGADRLSVMGFFPGGGSVDPGSGLSVNGELLEGVVPATRSTVSIQRGGRLLDVPLPGPGR